MKIRLATTSNLLRHSKPVQHHSAFGYIHDATFDQKLAVDKVWGARVHVAAQCPTRAMQNYSATFSIKRAWFHVVPEYS